MVAVDETVRVLDGAFAGFAGRVTSVDSAARTAVVNVQIFGRTTPVEVAADAVEPAEGVGTPAKGSIAPDPAAILDEE